MILIKKARKETRPVIYPLAEMAVGDILSVEVDKGKSLRSCVTQFVKNIQPTWGFKTKTVDGKVVCKRVK